jgi:predicted PurR-regulated permease PerM
VAAGAGVALFATIFFLYDGPHIWSWVTSLFPTRARTHVEQAGRLSWQTLSGYARGTVLIAAIDAVGIGVGVALIGVPLAVPIGVLVFFASFIPVIGALLSGLAAVLIQGRLVAIHPLAVVLAVTAGTIVAGLIGAVIAVPVVAVANVLIRYATHLNTDDHPPPPAGRTGPTDPPDLLPQPT